MTTLSKEDRDLVLWVLDKSHPSLEDSTNEDIHGPYVVTLTLDHITTLSILLEDHIDAILGDISGCISESAFSVLDRHREVLRTIKDRLNHAKPLISTPAPASN